MSRRYVLLLFGLWVAPTAAIAQERSPQPAMRTLYFKLPLAQTEYHWRFLDREALLSGRLTLWMIRPEGRDSIVVFDEGRIEPGWSPIDGQGPGEIYFGFTSARRYLTMSTDSLVLELVVTRDLEGIGPGLSGVLPAGVYRSTGSYSMLVGYWSDLWLETIARLEEVSLDELEAMPEVQALVDRLNASTDEQELRAFLQCWRQQWTVVPHGPGWLDPRQAAQQAADRRDDEARLAEMRARLTQLGGSPPEGPTGTDGRPCS